MHSSPQSAHESFQDVASGKARPLNLKFYSSDRSEAMKFPIVRRRSNIHNCNPPALLDYMFVMVDLELQVMYFETYLFLSLVYRFGHEQFIADLRPGIARQGLQIVILFFAPKAL